MNLIIINKFEMKKWFNIKKIDYFTAHFNQKVMIIRWVISDQIKMH